mmetsp:Transcript_8031/g.10377  ORF Transcript_8031/g.10377 Transcript_8031/m.10377 type:complete len:87 (-) Transcript_8031:323-583(-)
MAMEVEIGDDSGSDDDTRAEEERVERRQQAMNAAFLNLRCELPECSLEPWMVQPPRLQRQKACAFQEVVQLPCQNCGQLVETIIRY